MAKFFEKFLLRLHEGTVDEIEQLAREYDVVLPKTQPDSEEEIHEENLIEDLIDEAVQGPLVEDVIEDMEPPQIYVTENILEALHAKDLNLPQVYNMIFSNQLEQPYDGGLYLSPINQWIEASCAYSSFPNIDSFFYPNNMMFRFIFIHE